MKSLPAIYLLCLSLCTFTGCTREEVVCAEAPYLSPTGALPELRGDLAWINAIHAHLEATETEQLPADTLARLIAVTGSLSNLNHRDPPDDALIYYQARANRLVAFDLQNHGLYDSSRHVLSLSLTGLNRAAAPTPAHAYEAAYHHNLIAIAGEQILAYDLALRHSQQALALELRHGFMADAALEYLNQAKMYFALRRTEEAIQAVASAEAIKTKHQACFVSKVHQTNFAFPTTSSPKLTNNAPGKNWPWAWPAGLEPRRTPAYTNSTG